MNIAKEVLKKLEENLPELIMVTLERVSLERRVNNKEGVVDILKNRITAHNQQQIKFFLSSKLSRYYAKVSAGVSVKFSLVHTSCKCKCQANFDDTRKFALYEAFAGKMNRTVTLQLGVMFIPVNMRA